MLRPLASSFNFSMISICLGAILCVLTLFSVLPERWVNHSNNPRLDSFSSKTAYRNSRLKEVQDRLESLGQCKLVHMNALFRHGTRYPGMKDMRKIVEVHEKIIASASRSKLPQQFVDWKTPFSLEKDKALSSVGFEEMERLGRIFRQELDNIDGFKNYESHINVVSSSLSRAKLSALTFLQSFLGDHYSKKDVNNLIKENDEKLRFFDNCPHYTKSVLKDKSSKAEFKQFLNGPEIKNVIRDIKEKWSLNDVDLSGDDMKTLFVMCGFEIATNHSSTMKSDKCQNLSGKDKGARGCPYEPMFVPVENSPLCSLLEPEHYHIFEYLYDIKHYWTKSYPKEINWLQSCTLMSSILEQIVQAAKGHQAAVRAAAVSRRSLQYYLDQQNHLRSSFWFGHAETLLPVITLLGLFNQSSPLLSSSFPQRLFSVKDPLQRFSTFRVSNISPFSGNVALELYHCPHLAKGDTNGYRIQVRSNEKAVSWSLANDDASHTSLENFVNYMSQCLPKKYNHHSLCSAKEADNKTN